MSNPAAAKMRYLGVLGLLAECSVHVPEDLRQMIEEAFTDAAAANPALRWRRILNRVEIDVQITPATPLQPPGGRVTPET